MSGCVSLPLSSLSPLPLSPLSPLSSLFSLSSLSSLLSPIMYAYTRVQTTVSVRTDLFSGYLPGRALRIPRGSDGPFVASVRAQVRTAHLRPVLRHQRTIRRLRRARGTHPHPYSRTLSQSLTLSLSHSLSHSLTHSRTLSLSHQNLYYLRFSFFQLLSSVFFLCYVFLSFICSFFFPSFLSFFSSFLSLSFLSFPLSFLSLSLLSLSPFFLSLSFLSLPPLFLSR